MYAMVELNGIMCNGNRIDFGKRNIFSSLHDWEKDMLTPRIHLHSGRTDGNGGHHDWLNREGLGFGAYHYHHGESAHLHPDGKCPYRSYNVSVVNPYTNRMINIGTPYYYNENPYYSLNLVGRALTADDLRGVDLVDYKSNGFFHACPDGDSFFDKEHGDEALGRKILFTYPQGVFNVKNNTLFKTDGDELQLLCHNKKATDDEIECYAYVSLTEIGRYMTASGYFIDFAEDKKDTGVWRFKVRDVSVQILEPRNGDIFNIGDDVTVRAKIENTSRAYFTVGLPGIGFTTGYSQTRLNLDGLDEVLFEKFKISDELSAQGSINSVEQLYIKVGVHTGGTTVDAERDSHFSEKVVSINVEQLVAYNITFEDAIIKAVALTYAFEDSSYTKLTGNFDGQGLSFGLLQWNIGQGTLQPLLVSMNTTYPGIVKSIFAEHYNTLVSMLSGNINSQLSWAISINDASDDILADWKEKFIYLGNTPEFQSIQVSAVVDSVAQAKKIFDDFQLATERGVALSFDIAVQNWNIDAGTNIINGITSEYDKLVAMANSVTEQSASKWQSDVLARKMTIVDGIGTVHGKTYDIAVEFDIMDRPIQK